MSTTHSPAVVLDGVTHTWPDGTEALTDIDASFSAGRTGLIGDNGSGKTTLLRLITGELTPSAGSITTTGQVGHLPQQLTLRTADTVADLLGVGERLSALRAIEDGDASVETFEALAEDWDVEARSRARLDAMGLETIGLDRPVGTLSGGETVLTALTGLQLTGAEIILLDEPTNNLDRHARHRLYDTITTWPGTLIVVSHDVALLDLLDATAELRGAALTVVGGNYTAHQEHLAREQAAAQQALRTAEQTLRTEQRQQREAQTKLARRRRYAHKDFENKRKPKIVMKQRATEAQVSAGKLRGRHEAKVGAAQKAADEQSLRVRRESRIRIDLPDPDVPANRRLADLHDGRQAPLIIQGPERVALTGPTGIGKTRLLETLFDPDASRDRDLHAVARTERIGYLPQRLDHLDDEATILGAVRAATRATPPHQVRANLARFLFRGDVVQRRIGDLSGGERFRAALATLLLTTPPRQLLVLDEPTNNLDLTSIDELVDALEGYSGGLLVVSHDDVFLGRLGIDTHVELGADGLSRGELGPRI